MIRVLHVIGAMERAGAETFLMNTYRSIDKTQVQFDFLVHETRECAYDAEIRSLGGRIFNIPRPTAANLFTSYRKTCRTFFREHPGYPIVHGHMGSSAAVYLTEARKAGCFTIAHSHAQKFLTGTLSAQFDLASYPTRKVADYFFACSREAGIDRFGKNIVEGARFRVVPNGINADDYACNEEVHRLAKHAFGLEQRPVFAFAGRLAPEKNPEFLLRCFAAIRNELPHAVLLIAGAGPEENAMRELAGTLHIRDSIAFLGSTDIVPQILDASDVFLLPSKKEGFAVALLEAQASGLACICSDGVPPSACISQDVMRLPLEMGFESWAQTAIGLYKKASSEMRGNRVKEIKDAGFDAAQTARELCDFYLSVYEACSAPIIPSDTGTAAS